MNFSALPTLRRTFRQTAIAGAAAMLMILNTLPLLGQADPETRPRTQELLPETTVMFIQVDNFADMMAKMQESNFAKMTRDEEIAPLLEGLWEEAKIAYDDNVRDEIGLDLEDFQQLPQGEMTFAIIAPRRKKPELFLLLELNDESPALDKMMDVGRDLIQRDNGPLEEEQTEDGLNYETFMDDGKKVTFFQKDGLLVGCSSRDELDAFVDRWMGRETDKKTRTLAENRKFVTIMNRCRGNQELDPEARFFIDPIGLAKSSFQGNFAANAGLQMLPVFGVDGLAAVGGSMLLSEEDFESLVHAHVMLANPRNGIFEMIAMKPTIYEPEPWIPKRSLNYLTTSWDVDQLLAELTKIIENFYEEGKVDEWIEENINQEVGFDLKEDVLAHLSGRVTLAQWIEEPIRFNSQITAVSVGLSNVEGFEKAVEKVFTRINEEADEDDDERMVEMSYKGIRIWTASEDRIRERDERRRLRRQERAEERGQPVVEAELNIMQPAFAIVGDNFVFAMSLEAIKATIDVDQGEREALVMSDEYAEIDETIEKLLKGEMPVALGYSNPGESFRFLFELVRSQETSDFVNAQVENTENKYLLGLKDRFDANPLPEFDKVKKYFQPNGWVVTDDDTGWHMIAFQRRFDPDEEEGGDE